MILTSVGSVKLIAITYITYKGEKYPVKGTEVRWPTRKDFGGEEYVHNHALRHFSIGPNDEIPLHQQVEITFVLSGKLTALTSPKKVSG